MKKKLILVLTILFVCCTFMIGYVNAKDTVDARVPETIPDTDDVLQAILDEKFDFSAIKFSGASGGEITGLTEMKKILLTVNPGDEANIKGESWFSVYCLDSGAKYPQYSFMNFGGDMSKLEETIQVQIYIMFSLFNNPLYTDKFSGAVGRQIDPIITYELPEGLTDTTVLEKIRSGETVTIGVKKVEYVDHNEPENSLVILAHELTGDVNIDTLNVDILKSDLLLDKYTAHPLRTKDYNHAMWIIEHSYPTLGLKEAMSYAGASLYEAIADVLILTNQVEKMKEEFGTIVNFVPGDDRTKIVKGFEALEACDANVLKFAYPGKEINEEFCQGELKNKIDVTGIEDYVYSTVQYAIWKTTDGYSSGQSEEKLGNTLIGSDQLNILYSFLIRERDEYENYLTQAYTNKIELVAASGNTMKEDGDYYIYGPYSVKHDLFSINNISLSIADGIKNATIINADGEEITSVTENETFYVKCLKSSKLTKVNVIVKSEQATTFYPTTNRGRVYYAYYANTQNVVSGGKLVNYEVDTNFDLEFNPKTGVENVGVVFFAIVIAFSLGYVALAYKNKPLELE